MLFDDFERVSTENRELRQSLKAELLFNKQLRKKAATLRQEVKDE